MEKQQPSNENTLSPNEDQSTEPSASSKEDGRLKEWQDRGRVALNDDLAPDTNTTIERDFEPENVRKEKPKDDSVY